MNFLPLLISFLIALFSSFLIIKYGYLHQKFSYDHDLSGVQKFHTESTPRIGGVSLFLGLIFGFFIIENTYTPLMIIISLLPVLIIGLAEDFTKSISPAIRLIFSFFSAFIAIYLLDISIESIGWLWFDSSILDIRFFSVLITAFMIAGVTHSTNIIDGFNGLLLGYSKIVLLVLLWVAIQTEDLLIVSILFSSLGSIIGIFFFNFPKAKIFTGDGGAYLIGALLSIICLLLVKRNDDVSPWFALLLMSYPVFETFFSIYRKKFLRNISPGLPDGIHLHMLKYKRVAPLLVGRINRDYKRNAVASVLIWLFITPSIIPAIFWWDNNLIMISSIIIFCIYYLWIYFSIVRFKFGLGSKKLK